MGTIPEQMMYDLPTYYNGSPEVNNIMHAEGTEIEQLIADINDLFNQAFIDTATWGLIIHEREMAIKTDLTKPYDQRRSVLKARKRGLGVVQEKMLKDVAESFYGGQVEVIFQPERLGFTIKFISSIGVPKNLDDVKKAIEEIRPAHLRVFWEFLYLLIRDIHEVKTLAQMETITLDQFAGGVV